MRLFCSTLLFCGGPIGSIAAVAGGRGRVVAAGVGLGKIIACNIGGRVAEAGALDTAVSANSSVSFVGGFPTKKFSSTTPNSKRSSGATRYLKRLSPSKLFTVTLLDNVPLPHKLLLVCILAL